MSLANMRARIFSVENGVAVIIPISKVAGRGVEYRIPANYLPSGHGPGDQIEIAFLPDPTRREILRQNIQTILKDLPKR